MRCDVIIPVYNAFDALSECVESVIKYTDLKNNGLYLINDCSTDERISRYITEIKCKYSDLNIYVLENEKNLGFVGTVNKGMKASENDVLLLNSDTVVGNNWLEKIKNCAYSVPKVATVTPLSNNATLVSAPKGLQRNKIPEDITIDEYNSIIENCSFREYPELPTAHGFCMYIRREALNTVGFFDEKSFGRGYGEENDFSFRCIDFGFSNLLCDDTLVYHKESQSFSGEKVKLSEAHQRILENRYPIFFENINRWCKAFPISHILKNIQYCLNISKKNNVLLLIHDFETRTGGTTLHINDIIESLRFKFNFHVLYPYGDSYNIKSFFENDDVTINLPYTVGFASKYSRYNSTYAAMIEDIIKSLRITNVHVHHMLGHFFDIVDISRKCGIKPIITLHDFYSVCPKVNLLYCGEKFCMDIENKNCLTCIMDAGYGKNNIIETWQDDWHGFLQKFDKIIVPSVDTKQRILKTFDDLEITAIEHGVEVSKDRSSPDTDGVFNVAFIGVMCAHKGGNTIKQLLSSSASKDIMYHSFGTSLMPELCKSKGNYIYHGEYDRNSLSPLLSKNKIDLICFLQIVPETYSYTLNEAVASGIPVLSTDIGAGAQRVKENGLGWCIPADSDAKAVLSKIKEIKSDKKEFNAVLKNISKYNIKSVSDMASDYDSLYSDCAFYDRSVDYDALKNLLKRESSSDSNEYYKSLYEEITHSLKWRFISKIRIPQNISRALRRYVKKLLCLIRGK